MVAVRKWRPSGDQPHVTPFSALHGDVQSTCLAAKPRTHELLKGMDTHVAGLVNHQGCWEVPGYGACMVAAEGASG